MERPANALTTWRKSTYSGTGGSECVEVGGAVGSVLVRDTKDRTGTVLNTSPESWRRLTATLKIPA